MAVGVGSSRTHQIFETENIPANILSFLDLKEQAEAVRVCKVWNTAAKKQFLSSYLSYGQRHAVRSLTFNRPQISSFSYGPSDVFTDVFGKFALFLQRGELQTNAIIADLGSKAQYTVDVSRPLPLNLRYDLDTRINAALLPSSRLVTFTEDNMIRVWDYSRNSLLATQEFLQPVDEGKAHLGETVWIQRRADHLEVFDTQSQTLQSKIFPDTGEYCGEVIHSTSDKLFSHDHVSGADLYISVFSAIDSKKLTPLWTTKTFLDMDYHYFEAYGIVGANNQVVVTADLINTCGRLTIFSSRKNGITFRILNIKNGEQIGIFHEDYTHLSRKTGNVFRKERGRSVLDCKQFSWLSGDFLAIWLGKKIDVWHISSKDLLTSIDLGNLCQPEELDDTYPDFCPICSFEVENKEIRLVLKGLANRELRMVKFPIEVSLDSHAIRNPIPERSMIPSWDRLFNQVKNFVCRCRKTKKS